VGRVGKYAITQPNTYLNCDAYEHRHAYIYPDTHRDGDADPTYQYRCPIYSGY
jgi:hypothetical protein